MRNVVAAALSLAAVVLPVAGDVRGEALATVSHDEIIDVYALEPHAFGEATT